MMTYLVSYKLEGPKRLVTTYNPYSQRLIKTYLPECMRYIAEDELDVFIKELEEGAVYELVSDE